MGRSVRIRIREFWGRCFRGGWSFGKARRNALLAGARKRARPAALIRLLSPAPPLTCRPSADMRGYRGVKYFLFIFCYVFWVLSAILIAVGIYAKVAKEKDVVDTLTVDPALLFMAVGSLTFSIAFLGCFGALRNATCLLKTVGCRGPPLASSPFDGALPFLRTSPVRLHPGDLAPAAADGGSSRIRLHGRCDGANEAPDDENGASLPGGPRLGERHRLCAEEGNLDVAQPSRPFPRLPQALGPQLRCCGVDGFKDWSRNVYFQCSDSNPSLEACGVPFSCCVPPANQTVPNTMCGFGTQLHPRELAERHVFPDGCAEKIAGWLGQNVKMAAGLAGGLLLLEICVMSLAWAQACWINKVRRRRRKHRAALASKSASHKKEDVWLPAFADFDAQ
ncbi:tetraspanin-33 isoform X2 [Stigmatopora nigra]